MNKLLILIFTVACLSGFYHASFILASPAVMAGALACSAYDATGEGSIPLIAVELRTGSHNNNVQYFCKGMTDSPKKAIVWDAYNVPDAVLDTPKPCINDDATLSTYDWHETISARGMVTLTCHFKN